MTANVSRTPNRFHRTGDCDIQGWFGSVHDVTAIPFGAAHVHIRFKDGLTLDLTPADAVSLARQLPTALARLHHLPNLAGHGWADFPDCDCTSFQAADLDDHQPTCTARRQA